MKQYKLHAFMAPCPIVGDTDDPLGGQSKCDYDTEDRKVIPITGSIELIDFGTPD